MGKLQTSAFFGLVPGNNKLLMKADEKLTSVAMKTTPGLKQSRKAVGHVLALDDKEQAGPGLQTLLTRNYDMSKSKKDRKTAYENYYASGSSLT